jgi:alpha-tubulin suppressor-like RCC1 family protein
MKKILYIALSLCIIAIGTTACKKDKTTTGVTKMQISTGLRHSLVLKTDNTLWACGDNKYGQLGDGTYIDRNSLMKIADGIKIISAGGGHTLVLKTDNSLWACGYNENGQLGDGTFSNKNSLIKITENVKIISAGGFTYLDSQNG